MNLLGLLFVISLSLYSVQWDPIVPGIDYEYVRYQNFNDIHVVRVHRNNPDLIIDTMVAGERVKGSRERTTTLYNRYDQALTSWPTGIINGTRYKAVPAVNGYYFGMEQGTWISGGVANGWYIHRFTNNQAKAAHASGYSIQHKGGIFIGGCVTHPDSKNYILQVKNNQKIPINNVNADLPKDSVSLYTPQYDKTSPSNNNGLNILIELRTVAGLDATRKVIGTVKTIQKDKGDIIFPFDGLVIAVTGNKVSLFSSMAQGDEIEIHQGMDMFDEATCKTPIKELSWDKTLSALALDSHHLENGKRHIYGDTQRHPRTSMAYNSEYIFFYTVDGRTSKSRGMTIDELSEFAQNHLKATDGGALDGGGSTTMVVKGKIMNYPSDGQERTVTNAVLFAVPEARQFSKKFMPNERVNVIAKAKVYSGPGSNYHDIYDVSKETLAIMTPHRLSGVQAKGTNWWYTHIGTTFGWVAESNIKKV
jgi:hypothetical protein